MYCLFAHGLCLVKPDYTALQKSLSLAGRFGLRIGKGIQRLLFNYFPGYFYIPIIYTHQIYSWLKISNIQFIINYFG